MTPHRIAWVVASTAHGLMILNRYDQNHRELTAEEGGGILRFGVSAELFEEAQYSSNEILAGYRLLEIMKRTRPERLPLQIIDVGANVGTHTIAWADFVRGWGEVFAFEPQRPIFHALCGNIALNNLDNVYAERKAIGDMPGYIVLPKVDYFQPGSFGSVEILPSMGENIGQPVTYEDGSETEEALRRRTVPVEYLRQPVDMLKIDVEGMEFDVLYGAAKAINDCRPVIIVEWLKSDQHKLKDLIEGFGYVISPFDRHAWLCIHKEDPVLTELRDRQGVQIP